MKEQETRTRFGARKSSALKAHFHSHREKAIFCSVLTDSDRIRAFQSGFRLATEHDPLVALSSNTNTELEGTLYMALDRSLKMQPLPSTARQIHQALAARRWTQRGYRMHHVRIDSEEYTTLVRGQYYAGAVQVCISEQPTFELLCFSDDPVAEIYFYFGPDSHDPLSTYLWASLAPRHTGIVDIGSGTGLYSLLAARCAPNAKVTAFEPVPPTAARLRANAALNELPNVQVRQLLVSDFTGPFNLPCLYSPPETIGGPDSHGPDTTSWDVTASSLDQVARADLPEKIDLLRINSEGNEYPALDGARDRIESDRPVIFCRIAGDTALSRVAAFAVTKGYEVFLTHEEARELSLLGDNGLRQDPSHDASVRFQGTAILSPSQEVSDELLARASLFGRKSRFLKSGS